MLKIGYKKLLFLTINLLMLFKIYSLDLGISSIAFSPVSIPGSSSLENVLKVTSLRQYLQLETRLIGIPTVTEESWGTRVDFSSYNKDLALSHSGDSEYLIYMELNSLDLIVEVLKVGENSLGTYSTSITDFNYNDIIVFIGELLDISSEILFPVVDEQEYSSSLDNSILLNYGLSNRISEIERISESIYDNGLSSSQILDIARLWSMQSLYLSLTPNREWILSAAKAVGWLQLLNRSNSNFKSDGISQIEENIKELIDFSLYSSVPELKNLSESKVINKTYNLESGVNGAPYITSLYEALVRRRLKTFINGEDDRHWAFSYKKIRDPNTDELLFSETDAGSIAIRKIHRSSINPGSSHRVSYYKNSQANVIIDWLSSFTELWDFFPNDSPEGISSSAWNEPWNRFNLFLPYLEESLQYDTSWSAAQYDALGFSILASYDNYRIQRGTLYTDSILLHIDDVYGSFNIRFLEYLLGHKSYYNYTAITKQKQVWNRFMNLYQKDRMRILDSYDGLLLGLNIKQESVALLAKVEQLHVDLYDLTLPRDREKALTIVESLIKLNTYGDSWTIVTDSDINEVYSRTYSLLAYVYYINGLDESAFRNISNIAKGSFGIERYREDILNYEEDLSGWAWYFREGRNSAMDRVTRIRYHFYLGDYEIAENLADENISHYGPYSTTQLYKQSLKLLRLGEDADKLEWSLLEDIIDKVIRSSMELSKWYQVMDEEFQNNSNWIEMKECYHLKDVNDAIQFSLPFYMDNSLSDIKLDDLSFISNLSKDRTYKDELSLVLNKIVFTEWATMLGKKWSNMEVLDSKYIEESWKEYLDVIDEQMVEMGERNYTNRYWNLLPLYPVLRAVRYGINPKELTKIWASIIDKVENDPFRSYKDPINKIFSISPSILENYLIRVNRKSDSIIKDDLVLPDLDINVFYKEILEVVDFNVLKDLVFEYLKEDEVTYLLPLIPENDWDDWVRMNAPDGIKGKEWSETRNNNNSWIKEIREEFDLEQKTFDMDYFNWLRNK